MYFEYLYLRYHIFVLILCIHVSYFCGHNTLKKGVEEKKLGHKTISVTYPDNTPFGWAFDNFYDAKDFVKHLSNGNGDGKVTIFGGTEFKPCSNLTTKWFKSLMLSNLLWIICIDTTRMEQKTA